MQIDLPEELYERLRQRVAIEKLESEVVAIRNALDALEWQDRERQAIQEGIEAWRAGNFKELKEFDADFRARNNIAPSAQ